MAEDNKNFTVAYPMLLGEEFFKQATTTNKEANYSYWKEEIFGYHPQSYQSSQKGRSKSGRERNYLYRES